MPAPILDACYFGGGHADQWPRLARTLAWSARQHLPAWEVRVRQLPVPQALNYPNHTDSHVANTHKLADWARVIGHAPDGARVALLDADMLILRPLDAVWDAVFDVAYTVRRDAKLPLNAGVVFVRVSPATRTFFADWDTENQRLLWNPTEHRIWRRKYGGINQAALGVLLERATHGLRLHELPCVEWNCEDTTWSIFDPAVTRVLHIKSALRRTVFGLSPATQALQPLARCWLQVERAALQPEGV